MKKYFTLVELLVVIAIIGILLTILLPSLNKSREASRTAVCLSQIRQLALSYGLYTAENNNRTMGRFPKFPNKSKGWPGYLYDYHQSVDLMQCPSAMEQATNNPINNRAGSAKSGWIGDIGWRRVGTDYAKRFSYGINAWTWSTGHDGIHKANRYKSILNIDDASNTPIFSDAIWPDVTPLTNASPRTTNGSDNNIGRIYLDRHFKKKINVILIDGSGKVTKINKLLHFDWHKNFQHRDLPLL
ncbi:MAG: prepilin-type N-terminal cleavage/methylation domain-containing protein [Lentisphaeraceae bacterium]|nr:prepilin-type N-terminal cleavage/methylation domain-containing protein [Lentisphaeraceae bacterium]